MRSRDEALSSALSVLSEIDDTYFIDGQAEHFIQILHSIELAEVQLRANKAGLVHLAKKIVELAVNESAGSHEVFDEAGLVDSCEVSLVVTKEHANWK